MNYPEFVGGERRPRRFEFLWHVNFCILLLFTLSVVKFFNIMYHKIITIGKAMEI